MHLTNLNIVAANTPCVYKSLHARIHDYSKNYSKPIAGSQANHLVLARPFRHLRL